MRIGLLQLTDSAPVLLARELGYFAGLDVTLSIEPSWANIADKLAHGFLDAAVIVPPLAFAIVLGLRGPAQRLIVPQAISLGGNTITLESSLARRLEDRLAGDRDTLARARAFASLAAEAPEPPVLAMVHVYSTHHLLLRYWLAVGGIDPDRDVTLVVIPPAQTAEALEGGRIAGFCAGGPWGAVAERREVGKTIATSHDIWRNGPEKAFAVREDWAAANPEQLQQVLCALLRAGQFCDETANAPMLASTLATELGVDRSAVLDGLEGGAVFFRHAATYPWRSHAEWFLHQMQRWKLMEQTDVAPIAAQVYRPDLYVQAAASLGISIPRATHKQEGHGTAWTLEAEPSPIAMEPDGFCDGSLS